jgi:hypothetical protein
MRKRMKLGIGARGDNRQSPGELRLRKEVLRQLTPSELENVAGAGTCVVDANTQNG